MSRVPRCGAPQAVACRPALRTLIAGALVLLTATLLVPAAQAAEPKLPLLTGRVVDDAGVLSRATQDQIADWLAQYEQSSKRQVVVATVKSLQGLPIEDFGYRLGRAWGIGEKGRNTGAILLVAPAERAVRIEVGYGLEGELTDAISRTIIERDILPAFRQGNYDQGVRAGTLAMLRALGWKANSAEVNGSAPDIPVSGDEVPPAAFLILMVLFVMFRFLFVGGHGFYGGASYGGGVWRGRSGGGFSGRGGSFGGGGASGRW